MFSFTYWNYEDPHLITSRTLLSVQVSGLNIYESIVFINAVLLAHFFSRNIHLKTFPFSLSIHSPSSKNWPYALLENSFLYWVEIIFFSISTYSWIPVAKQNKSYSIQQPCKYLRTVILLLLHYCPRQFFMSHGFGFFTILSSNVSQLVNVPRVDCRTLAFIWT